MVLDESFLGPAPESLHAVDVDLAGREIFPMVHLQMPVAAEHEAVIASELVRVNDRPPADLLDGEPQKGLCRYIGHDIHLNQAVSLQNAKDGDLAGSASSPVAFSSAAEVGLIQFDLSAQKRGDILGMAQNAHANRVHGTIDGLIRQFHLSGHLVDRYFQFKELEEGQPLDTAQASVVDPATGEVMERIIAPGATISSIV